MKKILLLGGQHGNEPLGDILKAHIRRYAVDLLPYVTFKTANLKAKRAGVRYLESEINRSYDTELNTYESRRAATILRFIRDGEYDLVLDLHTTNCIQPPSILIRSIASVNVDYLRATHIDKIIEMRHSIAETSLIGRHNDVVSVEVSNHDLHDNTIIKSLADDIRRYVHGQVFDDIKQLYTVDELLLKADADSRFTLVNFEMSAQGFIPILTGENSYKKNTDYLGFRTDKVVKYRV
jgi:hypothetical protein